MYTLCRLVNSVLQVLDRKKQRKTFATSAKTNSKQAKLSSVCNTDPTREQIKVVSILETQDICKRLVLSSITFHAQIYIQNWCQIPQYLQILYTATSKYTHAFQRNILNFLPCHNHSTIPVLLRSYIGIT